MQTTETHANGSAKSHVASNAIIDVALKLIAPSPTNPRKTFEHIEELAESFKAHGILSPLLTRPLADGRFELVFGERRWRAAKLAKFDTVPVTVRKMSDDEVLEAQLVENCQREDVHPLEEAEAFEQLHKRGRSAEEIAAKIGKSLAHVYARMKLTALCKEGRDAFYAGKLTAATALLLARIPHRDLQKEALKDITNSFTTGQLPGLVEATRIVHRKFMLPLEHAPFDGDEPGLVATAGACGPCPKRTGNQRVLFSDVKATNVCTDPQCYAEKISATFAAALVLAKKNKWPIMGAAEAKKVFTYGDNISESAGYFDLDKPCTQDSKSRLWRQILAKATPLPVTLAKDDRGAPRCLIERADAMKLARDLGFAFAHEKKKASPDRENAKRDREKQIRRKRIMRALAGAVAVKAEKELTETGWRVLARSIIRSIWQDSSEEALTRRQIDRGKRSAQDALLEHTKTLKGPALRGLCFELAVARGNAWEIGVSLREACELFKVDVKKVSVESAKELDEPKKTKADRRGAEK